jgi:hypothetical protein
VIEPDCTRPELLAAIESRAALADPVIDQDAPIAAIEAALDVALMRAPLPCA